MQTLSIAHIFTHFDEYQAQYLNILQDPAQYDCPIADATLHVWPFAAEQLCLGEFLQLCLSQKWALHDHHALFDLQPLFKRDVAEAPELYLYQVQGNALTGQAHALAWSVGEQKTVSVEINQLWQYYSAYKTLAPC